METYDKLQKKPSSSPQRNSRHNKKSDNDKDTKMKQKQQQPRGILRRRKKEESVYSKLHVSSPNTFSNHNKKNKTIKSSLKKSSRNESASTLRNIESKTHEKHQTAFSTKHHLPKPPSSSSVHHTTPQYQRRMHSQQSRGVDRVDSRSEQNKDKQEHVLPSYQQTRSDEVNRKIRKDKKWTKLVKESVHIETNNVSKYQDTNKIAKTLHQMGLQDESQHFKRLIRKRFQLEEDFIKLNDQVGIQTIEGDYDECATPTHSSVGGLKIQKVPKSFIMVDEYDPKILIKNLNVLKDLEKRTIAIHRICLENQTK